MSNFQLWRFYAERFVFSGIVQVTVVWILRLLLFGVFVSILFGYLDSDYSHRVSFSTTGWLLVWAFLSAGWRTGELLLANAIRHEYVALAIKKVLFTAVLLFATHAETWLH